jgi:hypothetical protein
MPERLSPALNASTGYRVSLMFAKVVHQDEVYTENGIPRSRTHKDRLVLCKLETSNRAKGLGVREATWKAVPNLGFF